MRTSLSTPERWLEKGYEHFALYGPKRLSIKKMAEELGLPRSSFYYHFGDLDEFIDDLLTVHMEIVDAWRDEAKKACRVFIPDLHRLLAAHPIPLQFHRQLFLNRSEPRFNFLYMTSNSLSNRAFVVERFIAYYHLDLSFNAAAELFDTLTESWYSRLDVNDLSAEALAKITEEIMAVVLKLLESPVYASHQALLDRRGAA